MLLLFNDGQLYVVQMSACILFEEVTDIRLGCIHVTATVSSWG